VSSKYWRKRCPRSTVVNTRSRRLRWRRWPWNYEFKKRQEKKKPYGEIRKPMRWRITANAFTFCCSCWPTNKKPLCDYKILLFNNTVPNRTDSRNVYHHIRRRIPSNEFSSDRVESVLSRKYCVASLKPYYVLSGLRSSRVRFYKIRFYRLKRSDNWVLSLSRH